MRGFTLPALYKSTASAPPLLPAEAPLEEGETACFYSPNRRATNSCAHCGVFISDAWAAQWGTETVCLKCLELLRNKTKDLRYEAARTLWDNVALGIAVMPFIIAAALLCTLILYPFAGMVLGLTIITSPAAIFVAMRYWNSPRSLVPRGPWRLIAALVFSTFIISAWLIGGVELFAAIRSSQLSK